MIREMVAWAVLAFALWLVLVSTIEPLEILVGAAVAILAAVGAHAARRASGARFGAGARALRAVAAWPGTLLRDTGRLCVAATRRRAGSFRTVRLTEGAGPAWSCALLSSTPSAYVVDIDEDTGEALLHVLDDEPSALERALR
ncbi:hypothetical protein [Streptomyces sp. NPDC004856]|uniref:hypothetical protein n=1 Tax=Streptomyces sp. NPDC004856 TaxID=3154556 RepID=UPI0033B27A12